MAYLSRFGAPSSCQQSLAGATLHPSVPDSIRGSYNEGVLALAADCPRAAAVMARLTLEAVAVDKGESTETLARRLSKHASKKHLHPSLTDWVKKGHLVGNSGAHYDPPDPVEANDAQHLINFVRDLLNHLYVLPWELDARRSAKPKWHFMQFNQ